ncbi:MAG: tRNA (guanosine(37)-N1)-methyltransferase TrmD [Candidatus Omnitrophica bacterium]|nr:tRNA (guanosine(37)-N1)-methyltransferase TrmD [Candidatus Omnitrophota bacterium]
MKIDVLTLFPKMFENVLGESMLKRAQVKGRLEVKLHNLRDWTFDNHRTVDDKPFGGGPGMVMKVEPVYRALEELGSVVRRSSFVARKSKSAQKVILLTPQGKKLDQKTAKRLSKEKQLILICGHYEGIDERIRRFVDEEISIGDYVMTCGEIPAMVLIDTVARLIPGVLGDQDSLSCESFEDGLLEYPQYTRPADFMGMKVPDIVLSGDHKKIEAWRKAEALRRTAQIRPDLLKIQKSKFKN